MDSQKCTDGSECGIGGYCVECPHGWTVTHHTKSYVAAPFGDPSPLEQIELHNGERQIAVIPVDVFKAMVADVLPILLANDSLSHGDGRTPPLRRVENSFR